MQPIGQSPQISSVAVNQSEVLGLKGILFDATLSGFCLASVFCSKITKCDSEKIVELLV